MVGRKFNPKKRQYLRGRRLISSDKDLGIFYKKLDSLRVADFPIKEEIDSLLPLMTTPDLIDTYKLIKLLYSLGNKKQVYLLFGIIIEELLNSVALLYIQNSWNIHAKSKKTLDLQSEFIDQTLANKATKLIEYDLFNDDSASRTIGNAIKSLAPSRNYGGHFIISNFIYTCLRNDSLTDEDFKQCVVLINKIDIAIKNLIAHPP